MSIKFEQGWGAPRFSEQFPELPKNRAESLDRLNRAVTHLYLADMLTDGELDRIRNKRFPRVVAAELKKVQQGGRDDG